jgi:hypothetical protein
MNLTLKRNYSLIALLILLTLTLILGLGDQRIVAYTVPNNERVMIYFAQNEIAGLLGVLGIP